MATTNIAAKKMAGVVVGAGRMMKTVKVRMAKEEWNRHLRKNYTVHYNLLVNDPASSVREGDIITMTPERHSKHVLHTVSAILAPFGIPLSERPPLLTAAERESIYLQSRLRKLERRKAREAEGREQVEPEAEPETQGKDSMDKGRGIGEMAGAVRKQTEGGRTVLPGGGHKFGKINVEAQKGKRRVEALERKTAGNEERSREVGREDGTARAKQALKRA